MITLVLILLGLCAGSFVNALVWRLHQQSKLKKHRPELSILHGRSMCPHCKHPLTVSDLVPLISWLWLRGYCRYCHQPISWQYPLVEVLMAFVFVSSYMLWPYTLSGFSVVNFGIWLGVVTLLMALAVYDARWMLLPNRLVYPLSALVAVLVVGLAVAQQNPGMIFGSFAGAALLSGIFYLLFQLSSGRWIGGGDVRLAVALGALSGGMIASILVLFIASLLGSIVGIPMMAKHRSHRHILPFGPFLIMATFIVFLFGSNIIAAYNSLVGI